MPQQLHTLRRGTKRYSLNDNSAVSLDPLVSTWVSTVVLNGGASPSSGSVSALNAFVGGLYTNNLMSSMITINCFVPDNLIACQTPIINLNGVGGLNPWTNTNFVGGDLTINGLVGDGSSKYLNTGIIPSNVYKSINTCGISTYVYTNAAVTGWECGTFASNQTTYWFGLSTGYTGNGINSDLFEGGYGVTSPVTGGFYSTSRIANTDQRIFFANSANAFSQLGATGTSPSNAVPIGNTVVVFAIRAQSGTVFQYSNHRMSFLAFHYGLTGGQTQTFFNLVQNLRKSIGGGYL